MGAQKNWGRCRSESAFLTRSTIYEIPDTYVSDAYTTQCKSIFSALTRRVMSVMQQEILLHARDRQQAKKERHWQSLSLFGPLLIIAIYILRALPRSWNVYLLVIVMTDRYPQIPNGIPTTKTTATHGSIVFSCHWIVLLSIRDDLLTDNGSRFESWCFAAICKVLGLKVQTTPVYHPQIKGHIERYNRTVVKALTPIRFQTPE